MAIATRHTDMKLTRRRMIAASTAVGLIGLTSYLSDRELGYIGGDVLIIEPEQRHTLRQGNRDSYGAVEIRKTGEMSLEEGTMLQLTTRRPDHDR